MKLHVVLEQQEESGFIAYVPELPGRHTQGETRAEAIENIREAKDAYLDALKEKKRSATKVEVIALQG
ncbi:type II toxin-antitoxin system HicB family antitoxin [Candidatus Micrarchaeota archaeon]|nr:type II toxin-antitoxin system HicB family antitoxin [Candidatus Micrarchaeota archaeon]